MIKTLNRSYINVEATTFLTKNANIVETPDEYDTRSSCFETNISNPKPTASHLLLQTDKLNMLIELRKNNAQHDENDQCPDLAAHFKSHFNQDHSTKPTPETLKNAKPIDCTKINEQEPSRDEIRKAILRMRSNKAIKQFFKQ